MDENNISRIVEEIISGLPDSLPYCIYIHGGWDIHDDVVRLVGRRTSSLIVGVMPRCDYYDVNLDQLIGG